MHHSRRSLPRVLALALPPDVSADALLPPCLGRSCSATFSSAPFGDTARENLAQCVVRHEWTFPGLAVPARVVFVRSRRLALFQSYGSETGGVGVLLERLCGPFPFLGVSNTLHFRKKK